jgi:hypothetical protein
MSVLRNFAIDCRLPPSSLRSPAAAPTRQSRRHHRSPRPPELHRRPEPEITKTEIGAAGDLTIVRPAAAARLEQVEQVGRHRAAPLSRARDNNDSPLSVLQNLAIVVDDPVAGCDRRRHHGRRPRPGEADIHHQSSVAPITRAPSSAPNSANNNFVKKRMSTSASSRSAAEPAGRNFGLEVGMVGTVKFEVRIKELVENLPDLAELIEPLLIVRRALREQIVILHRRLLAIVRDDEVCRRS